VEQLVNVNALFGIQLARVLLRRLVAGAVEADVDAGGASGDASSGAPKRSGLLFVSSAVCAHRRLPDFSQTRYLTASYIGQFAIGLV
jgi:hypothetical protein